MPKFSLLARLHQPKMRALNLLIDSLEAQTITDWELILVVDPANQEDHILGLELCAAHPKLRLVERPLDQLLAWTCNDLLGELGEWVGLINQHDFLLNTALSNWSAGIATAPAAKVVYADECLRDRWGRNSFRHTKAAFDAQRLRYQEYLGAAMINTAWLASVGGFDRLASDWPIHDLYLRLSDELGAEGFAHVPGMLLQHYRDYLAPMPADSRLRPYMPRYDLYAIRKHLQRNGLTAKVRQENGTVRIEYQHPDTVGLGAFLVLTDDVAAGIARIHAFSRSVGYRPMTVSLLHLGEDSGVGREYLELGKSLGYAYLQSSLSLPEVLNQQLTLTCQPWILVIDGKPIRWNWLGRLMDQTRLEGVAAIGGRCSTPVQLHMPGTLSYRYEGWDWNTRGRFNHLQVPHQIGALGSHCLLLDVRKTLAVGGFREDLPTLYAMELSLRLDAAGHALISHPEAHVQISEPVAPSTEERTLFTTSWPTWMDRFGLHLPT